MLKNGDTLLRLVNEIKICILIKTEIKREENRNLKSNWRDLILIIRFLSLTCKITTINEEAKYLDLKIHRSSTTKEKAHTHT